MQLLSHSVRRATRGEQGGLVLLFDDGQVLELLDDSAQYESFRLKLGDREVIV